MEGTVDMEGVGAGAGVRVQGTGEIGIMIGETGIIETAITEGMGVGAGTDPTGMIEMGVESDMVVLGGAGAQSEKVVKNGGPGLNNGTEKERKSCEKHRVWLVPVWTALFTFFSYW